MSRYNFYYTLLRDYFATFVGAGADDDEIRPNSYAPSAATAAMIVATIICFVLLPESLFLNSGERNCHIVSMSLSSIEK